MNKKKDESLMHDFIWSLVILAAGLLVVWGLWG